MEATREYYLDHCRSALSAIEQVLGDREGDVSETVSHAIRCIVRARDQLIEERRSGTSSPQSPHALKQVNALLSLTASVEYPLAGVHWPRLEEARDTLRKMAGGSDQS